LTSIEPDDVMPRLAALDPELQDRTAEALVEEFDRLARLALLLTGDQSRAEDAAAEAIARVWQRSEIIEIEQVRPYLRRKLINIVSKRRRRFFLEHRALERRPSNAEVVLDAAAIDRIDLSRALLLLPLDQRVVIALRYFEDLSEDTRLWVRF